ncbi:MAG TPA: tetratricopeptide repeat-containing glycosyltransferase family protein [Burkholderiales bacterium]|jgi:tetratricopeptide (TPR) repeat protein|nr:tetratricopeptide repeat-containing glycosyltransferase family protein [Burkholderiales bacterium]
MTMATRDRSSAEAIRQATLCLQRGEWLSAEGICRYVLEASPGHAEALELLAEACFAQGRLAEALDAYDQALQSRPQDAGILYNRGVVLDRLGRHADALASFDQALSLQPRDLAALVNRGNALHALRRFAEALGSFDRALALAPRNVEARYNRGNALLAMDHHEEALASFDEAIAHRPDHADALLNRGLALAALGRHAEALESYRRALAVDPRRAEAHYNRGNALRALERDADAVASYDAALALQPEHPDAHWNRAWALLALGDYERGWLEHEWRSKSPRWLAPPPRSAAPRWLGESDCRGRALLVLSEQGTGDTVQYLRYVPLLAARGARVLLELPRSLERLCMPYRKWATLVFEDQALPPHDLHCPIASLPLAFKTTVETIPAQLPYLDADPALVAQWRETLAPAHGALRAGLVWAGNPKQGSERRRGIGLEPCLPLLEVPGVRWHSLQVGERASDLARLASGAALDLSERLTDFAETAAVIANLDLVVTTDTAVAHIAGALGKPVWVLLMFAADWRWLRGRDDSPWYPSARLFRQQSPGDWRGVIDRVKNALERSKEARP